jgi:hypothetical protein
VEIYNTSRLVHSDDEFEKAEYLKLCLLLFDDGPSFKWARLTYDFNQFIHSFAIHAMDK